MESHHQKIYEEDAGAGVRRHHEPIGQTDSHGVLRRAVYHDSVIHRHYLGSDCRDCRAFGGWLGVAGLSGMLRWRDAVPVSRYQLIILPWI